ncbi:MAG: pyrroline-5-carboxylate reductase [Deltaproteobacteria bacterium]|nr:pyrroline-5-carboxylate reductase [Deltaproteobacteria bacterium]MBW2070731.1 pyrroline-5-carboxylate reductase [Deltaproteobacteria bacterium]
MLAASKVGFIGGGNMGEALIKGLLTSERLAPEQISVSDVRHDRLLYLQNNYGVHTTEDNGSLARDTDIMILAVKPQNLEEVVAELKGNLAHSPLLISIVAGVSLHRLQSGLVAAIPMVRVMPNAAALVLEGASAIAPGEHATAEHLAAARVLFESVGKVVEVKETDMDAVTGLSGSGPGYILLFMEALIDAGVFLGLSRSVARDLVVQTTLGTARLLAQSDEHPATLRDRVTSPAGTTINGLQVMERAALRATLIDAVAAATERARALGKK